MRPQPFECRFTPRSDEIKATVKREGEQALGDLAIYDGDSEKINEFFRRMKATA